MRRFVMGLGLLAGLLVACGGNGDGAERDAGGTRPTEPPQGSTPEQAAATTSSVTTTPPPPRVVYEVTGSGAVQVSYWVSGDRTQSREVTLPWSEEQAEEPSRTSILVALVGSEGDVTCRIRRGDEVLAEATLSSDAGPLLSCDYPPTGEPPITYPPDF